MFWKYDDEEEKVVPREPKLSPSEFAQKAREAGHASLVHGLDQEDREVVFKKLQEDDFQSSDETGAEQRFESRVAIFKKEDKPVYKHHVWWFIHNCIAHPLIGVAPCKKTFDFHDWTSKKINGK